MTDAVTGNSGFDSAAGTFGTFSKHKSYLLNFNKPLLRRAQKLKLVSPQTNVTTMSSCQLRNFLGKPTNTDLKRTRLRDTARMRALRASLKIERERQK